MKLNLFPKVGDMKNGLLMDLYIVEKYSGSVKGENVLGIIMKRKMKYFMFTVAS